MAKDEKYKVVIREKTTQAVVESSDVIDGYDAWIHACNTKGWMWDEFAGDKTSVYIEIIDEAN